MPDPDRKAAEELFPLVYDELRKLAEARMRSEGAGHTLQPTALVHEAYLRLVGPAGATRWDGRGHFFAAAAEAMRRILVEAARRKLAGRHGGGRRRVALSDGDWLTGHEPDRVLEVDDAVAALEREDPQAAALARLHLFAGMPIDEAAAAMGLSRSSAYREWAYARARLSCLLTGPP